MTDEEIKALVKQSTQPIIEANAKLTQENAELKSKVEKFTKDEEARVVAEKANKVKLAREAVTKVLDDAVKAQAITPAQREAKFKILGVNDDERVVLIDLDAVKADLPKGKKVQMNRQEGKGQGEGGDGSGDGQRVYEDADQELDRLANEIVAENPKVSYGEATRLAMKRNPELAKEWLGAVEE